MRHPFEHDITALAYDLVDGAERDTLLEHLAACDECRAQYDAQREEQVVVREAIVSDRSGASEAKALERTLRMLEGEAEPKRGRLLRLPMIIAAEIAAVLLVAVGLFFLLKPDPETKPERVPVADINRAPATVESGVAYVQTPAGGWEAAEAVPVDQWVKTGDEAFIMQIKGGPRADLQPDSVFRISFEAGQDQPLVYVLRGGGVITAPVDGSVRTGDANFYAMPGAKLSVTCETDKSVLRSWSVPANVRARVISGDILLSNYLQPARSMPLKPGETFEWKPSDARLIGDDQTIVMDVATLFQGDSASPEERQRMYRVVELRFADLAKRLGEDEKTQLWLAPQWTGTAQVLPAPAARQKFTVSNGSVSMTLSTSGTSLKLVVSDATGTSTFEKRSVDALKAELRPEIADLLEGFEIEYQDGRYTIKSAGVSESNQSKTTGR